MQEMIGRFVSDDEIMAAHRHSCMRIGQFNQKLHNRTPRPA
ncbi:hypothetical protein [Loktanella fryxellensis]|nr:hypothetical protein [Loktanella fryxellensis]